MLLLAFVRTPILRSPEAHLLGFGADLSQDPSAPRCSTEKSDKILCTSFVDPCTGFKHSPQANSGCNGIPTWIAQPWLNTSNHLSNTSIPTREIPCPSRPEEEVRTPSPSPLRSIITRSFNLEPIVGISTYSHKKEFQPYQKDSQPQHRRNCNLHFTGASAKLNAPHSNQN